jgi:hypothetical protein
LQGLPGRFSDKDFPRDAVAAAPLETAIIAASGSPPTICSAHMALAGDMFAVSLVRDKASKDLTRRSRENTRRTTEQQAFRRFAWLLDQTSRGRRNIPFSV